MAFNFPGGSAPSSSSEGGQRKRGALFPTIIILGVLVVAFVIFTGFYTDFLWFDSLTKSSVFTTQIYTKVALFAVFTLVMALVVFVVMWWAWKTRPEFRGMTPEQASLERYRDAIEPFRTRLAIGIAIVLGLFAGFAASAEWDAFLMWRNATDFGQVDPQFGLDLSFFVFTLPFIQYLLGFGFAVLLLSLIAAVIVQYLYGGLRLQPKGDRATGAAQTQVSVLIALILFLKAASYWFDRFALDTQSQSLVTGFTGLKYTDVHAVLPSLNILTFVALIVGVLFLFNAFKRSWPLAFIGLGLMILTSIVVGVLYPLVIQQFQVRPSELVKEQPYIGRNIESTRAAYNIADSNVADYPGTVAPPTAKVITASQGTLSNIRLLDPALVSPTFNQLQQIRGYYSFNDKLDIDRYNLNKKMDGAVVAVREINLNGINAGQRNWTNDKTVYTHGYGFVAAYDNTVQDSGQPDFFAKNIPPVGALQAEQPRVYFGENSPLYSVVGAPKGQQPVELDYPDDASPTGQKNYTYQGTGGVPIGSFFNKLLFATKFQDGNLILSDLVNPDSRILYERDPLTRVSKVAPWLTLDQDPYPIVADGRIKWVVDGYTTSNNYPYSSRVSLANATSDSLNTRTVGNGITPLDQINYMRNSVKAVVDAYDGTVTLYAWDPTDPVLKTWMKAFPDTVTPREQMDPQILAHVRYPQDVFKVQRTILSRYHVTDASTFYNGTDVWIVPFDPTITTTQVFQPPYYLTLQMPDQKLPTFSLTSTFAPQGRQTLAGFMSVSSDPLKDYGKIRVLQLPSNTTIPGPQQVQNAFESDPSVSSQLSLLRRGGSEVDLGNLLSLPFNDGLLYVEPVYLRASADGFPLLQKVLVGYGQNVAMEDTLVAALNKVFSLSPGAGVESIPSTGDVKPDTSKPTPTPSTSSNGTAASELSAAITDAQRAYEAGLSALKNNDFTAYDQAQKQLAAALKRAAAAEAKLTGKASGQSA